MPLPHSNFFFKIHLDELLNDIPYEFFEKKLYTSKDLNTLYSYFSLSICLKSCFLSDNKFLPKAGLKVLKYFYTTKKEEDFNRQHRNIMANSILLCILDSLIAGVTGANPHLIPENHKNLKESFRSPFKNNRDILTIAQGCIYFEHHMGVKWKDSEKENILEMEKCFNCLEESYNLLSTKISDSKININELRLYLIDRLIHSYNTEKYDISTISTVLDESLSTGRHVFSKPLTLNSKSCAQIFLGKLKELT